MPQSAAAVVDLEEFRRRRAAREVPDPARAVASTQRRPMLLPVCVVWVPVWPVA